MFNIILWWRGQKKGKIKYWGWALAHPGPSTPHDSLV